MRGSRPWRSLRLTTIGVVVVLAPLTVVPSGTSSTVWAAVGGAFGPENTSCGGKTFVQTGTASEHSYAAPGDGVITSYQFVQGATPATSLAFKLAREGAAPGALDIVATTALLPVGATGLVDRPVRMVAKAGDYLGVYVVGADAGTDCGAFDGEGPHSIAVGNAGVGPMVVSEAWNDMSVDVGATWEPDVDRDGYGDVSQDDCPTDATTQGVCVAPDTSIVSAGVKKKTATVVFTATRPGSSFQCAVDSPVFVPCTSPYVKKLKPGKHLIAVRAVGADGLVDASAVLTSVKVRKPHHRPAKK